MWSPPFIRCRALWSLLLCASAASAEPQTAPIVYPSAATAVATEAPEPSAPQVSTPSAEPADAATLHAEPQSESAADTSDQQPGDNKWWGWVVTGASLLAGGTLAVHGLSIRCGSDIECQRSASLWLWGGIGIASAGSLAGFVMLQGQPANSDLPPSGALFGLQGRF